MIARPSGLLFLTHTAELGGAELSLLDIASHYPSGGTVLSFYGGPLVQRLQERGVRVRVVRGGSALRRLRRNGGLVNGALATPYLVRLIIQVCRAARSHRLIYANTQKAFVVSALASSLVGRPVIWHLRDILDGSHFGKVARGLVVFLANARASLVIANSHATARAFIASGGTARCVVVHNGIDAVRFSEPAGEPDRKLFSNGWFTIGCFDRISSWKGQHIALAALRDIPCMNLVIVGDCLFGETDYRDHLRDLVRDYGLAERVRFLGFRDDVGRLMASVDAVVHPSVAPEPFGRVMVEAMLAGKPVIASAAGGALEIITDGVDGLLVAPGDPQALKDALLRVSESPELAERIGEAAAQSSQRFSLDAMFTKLDSLLGELSLRHSHDPNYSGGR